MGRSAPGTSPQRVNPAPAPQVQREPAPEQYRRPEPPNIMGLDKSDLSLAAMLFLLYLESHDEDFLIILAIIAFSIFKKPKEG